MVTCHFSKKGFKVGACHMRPCGVAYHTRCIRVGIPFTSRRDDGGGLSFPESSVPPVFICESCTVRSFTRRELNRRSDMHLLALERMRMLDIAHSWAPGTYAAYQPYLQAVSRFQQKYQVPILKVPTLSAPPANPVIPLMWCHESYGLRQGRRRSGDSAEESHENRVKFATVRQLRSAVAQWETMVAVTARPGTGHFDQSKRLVHQACRGTDTASFTLFARGLAARTGTDARPSKSLLHQHVFCLDQELYARYCSETDDLRRRELALAGLMNVVLWLGWFRSSEALGIQWADLGLILPVDGPSLGLPPLTGAVMVRLRPETKSDRSHRADMILAYQTNSGFALGRWVLRCVREHPLPSQRVWESKENIFTHCDGSPWSSREFRERYLYPSLRRQRAEGDPYLLPFGAVHGITLEEAFWSLGSYRNGARSHVSRSRTVNGRRLRKATPEEVYEHARWRRRRNNEAIDKIYQQWSPHDRLAITQECM